MISLLRKLTWFFRRYRKEDDLSAELQFHIDEEAEELEADGLTPESARRAARIDLGNLTLVKEETRLAWTWMWLEQCWQDLSYGVRVLCRAPAFTLGAVAVLALGIGVNLAELQIFDAMLFHRLTIRDAVSLLEFFPFSKQGQRGGFPSGAVEFYRAESRSFAWLLSEDTSLLDVVVEGETGLHSNFVSPDYFGSLGIVPTWGRLIDARDGEPGAPAVAVLGYSYWQTHWASDPHIVGRILQVNNTATQIVGVLPDTFEGLEPRATAVWLPIALRPQFIAGSLPVQEDFSRASERLFGKLKPGVSRAAGEAELTALTRELIRRHPRSFREDDRIRAQFVQQSIRRFVWSPPAAVFIMMVFLVLLSACANLGNMLLARGLARQREISIRLAVGAGRARIVRQLMTENLLLAVLGGAAGLALGAISARQLLNALGSPMNIRLALSWPIVVAGVVLAFASTVVFGLPAAFRTVAPDQRKLYVRQKLVAVQVAVSCLLLIAAGVLGHNGIASASVDLAFDYQNMLVVDPHLYGRNLPAAVAQLKLDVLSTRLRELPGVEGVTTTAEPPLSGRTTIDSPPGLPHVYRNAVAPSYFDVMKLPIVHGRTFAPGDRNDVIVSESAARSVWPNQDPLGKAWDLGGVQRTVVGVAKDSGANLLSDADSIEAYAPILDMDVDRSALILHTHGDLALLVRMILAVAGSLDETVSVSLMRASRDNFLAGQLRMIKLIGSIGAVATVLAAVGMFALIAFTVAQRSRELGIRIAIGARPLHVVSVLLKENLKPMAIGSGAGVILAVGLSRVVRTMIVLQNRDAVDIIGFAAGLVCFGLVAVLATLSPIVRALRIDPSSTLREG